MKKAIIIIVAAISLVMIPAEAETPFMQLLWSGGWMAVFAISAKLFDKYFPEEKES